MAGYKRTIVIGLFCFCAAFCMNSNAQVWQWSVPVTGAKNKDARAFLWIPENCKKLHGVVVAQNNMQEQSILEHAAFRGAMAALGFAEIWVSPSFDHLFLFTESAGEIFNSMIADLAEASGYTELKNIPVVPIGHSASASWPYYFAAWKPERTLCAISVSGQWPYFRSPQFAPDIWGNRNIDYIPCLEIMGEYEAANTWSTEGLKERKEHPLLPLSMLACPAEGHFAATQKKIAYIALYIKKAVQYRLIKDATTTSAGILKQIDPAKTGWLADKWRLNEEPAANAAPVGKYTGDPSQAFWFFDSAMVAATSLYEAAHRNMKAQLLGYLQEGKIVPQKNTHLQVDVKFQPLQDGITFILKGTFLDTVPGAHQRTSDWTGLPAGSPIGHASGYLPVAINKIIGPFTKVNDSIFRVALEKGLPGNPKTYTLTFAATHPGDKIYKPAVQQAQMMIPAKNNEGNPQHVDFPKIHDQQATAKSIHLQAKSDAGLPVYYYMVEGPAEINGNKLSFTKIPPRSKYPVKITITAWQYGIAGKIQSADPVTQTFYIRN